MADLATTGQIIDERYEIRQLIGRGSMADVFSARDRLEDQEVAIKILRSRPTMDSSVLKRLQREARVQKMIDHRNVAKIFGGGATEGRPYLVFELLRGHTLRRVSKAGPISAVRASSYIWQALQGLAATHKLGVLHRDLKPANFMLEPSPGPVERVVLIDFGFAALEGSARLTAQGHVVGSLAYIAPERLRGQPGDERSDLYGVGVIFYELLVGRRPFVADKDLDLIHLHLDTMPIPPSLARAGLEIPDTIDRVVMRALSKEPESRYQNAVEMADELELAAQEIGRS